MADQCSKDTPFIVFRSSSGFSKTLNFEVNSNKLIEFSLLLQNWSLPRPYKITAFCKDDGNDEYAGRLVKKTRDQMTLSKTDN